MLPKMAHGLRLESRTLIKEYSAEVHEKFVPRENRDASRMASWGASVNTESSQHLKGSNMAIGGTIMTAVSTMSTVIVVITWGSFSACIRKGCSRKTAACLERGLLNQAAITKLLAAVDECLSADARIHKSLSSNTG